jgi:hypothetical protein
LACSVLVGAAAWLVPCGRAAAEPATLRSQCLQAYADAQELRLQGSLLDARARLLLCSQSGCPRPVVKDCTEWLGEVESSLSSVVFAISDERGRDLTETRVSVESRVLTERTDGRALALDPGTYQFSFEAEGYVRAQQTVVMRQSEKNRIVRVQLSKIATRVETPAAVSGSDIAPSAAVAPSERGRSIPIGSLVLGGVALAGAGTFAYFGISGLNKKADANRCQANCRGLIDAGKRAYVVADIALGVAVLAASSALVWYLLPSAHAESADARSHQLQALPPGPRAF